MNDKLRSLIHGRTGLIDTSYRWENGIVPYYINSLYFSELSFIIFVLYNQKNRFQQLKNKCCI